MKCKTLLGNALCYGAGAAMGIWINPKLLSPKISDNFLQISFIDYWVTNLKAFAVGSATYVAVVALFYLAIIVALCASIAFVRTIGFVGTIIESSGNRIVASVLHQ